MLQNAESVGEMPKFSIQRGIFDALKVTPY